MVYSRFSLSLYVSFSWTGYLRNTLIEIKAQIFNGTEGRTDKILGVKGQGQCDLNGSFIPWLLEAEAHDQKQ